MDTSKLTPQYEGEPLSGGKPNFRVTRLTPLAKELVDDIEQSYCRLAAAVGDQDIDAAYTELQARRKKLLDFIGSTERAAGISVRNQTVTLRF